MSIDSGYGVQVVTVEDSGGGRSRSYRLDEQALRAVLLQEGVADCPVVVVSVAGVYRGGKSFLLGFFLRYLYAELNTRTDGSWLGKDCEPLKGFSWRGGSDPDTDGLLLWSQPIHVTMPSGEQVAVVLMDTQGTFDCRSTVRDCSTIFALSTLLSSVQIYNLYKNIKADDMQHLQLFTEYGRLVRDHGGEKPFQALQFLVRDWSFKYEYDFGVRGGRELLRKRIQANSEQVAELQELWQHVISCFDTIDCFLMPNPGENVTSKREFDGRLADIDEQFKASLLEFVPSILSSINLVVKKINGEPVTGRQLFYYFTSYLDVFNSDELPRPRTIKEATAEAELAAGACEARALYTRVMERESTVGVTKDILRGRHNAAVNDAMRIASTRKTMANEQRTSAWRNQLKQELDDKFEHYLDKNEAKIKNGIADAKRDYDVQVEKLTNSKPESLCLHPNDLETVHEDAAKIGMTSFESAVSDDGERADLLKYFEERLRQLRELNNVNNTAALMKAREIYAYYIDFTCGEQPCVTEDVLVSVHEDARKYALELFTSKRNQQDNHPEDTYRSELEKHIEEQLLRLQRTNESNNDSAVQAALLKYDQIMESVCAPKLPCVYPKDLILKHNDANQEALTLFKSKRIYTQHEKEKDSYKEHVEKEISKHFLKFEELNNANNETAVRIAIDVYRDAMENGCKTTPWQSKETLRITTTFDQIHDRSKKAAIRTFCMRRVPKNNPNDEDIYEKNLLLMIDARRGLYHEELMKHLASAAVIAAAGVVGGTLVLGKPMLPL